MSDYTTITQNGPTPVKDFPHEGLQEITKPGKYTLVMEYDVDSFNPTEYFWLSYLTTGNDATDAAAQVQNKVNSLMIEVEKGVISELTKYNEAGKPPKINLLSAPKVIWKEISYKSQLTNTASQVATTGKVQSTGAPFGFWDTVETVKGWFGGTKNGEPTDTEKGYIEYKIKVPARVVFEFEVNSVIAVLLIVATIAGLLAMILPAPKRSVLTAGTESITDMVKDVATGISLPIALGIVGVLVIGYFMVRK